MAKLGIEFVTADLPEGGAFDPVPAGWYNATITEADLKTTKAGDGHYIALRFDITGPAYQGRVVWGNLNIHNPNAMAEEIGRRDLGDIARSIGLEKISDTDQLVGGNLQIKVTIKKDDQYGDKNEVRGYKALDGAAPMPKFATPATPTPAPQTEKPTAAVPPWLQNQKSV
jgi:hypothetical protein